MATCDLPTVKTSDVEKVFRLFGLICVSNGSHCKIIREPGFVPDETKVRVLFKDVNGNEEILSGIIHMPWGKELSRNQLDMLLKYVEEHHPDITAEAILTELCGKKHALQIINARNKRKRTCC